MTQRTFTDKNGNEWSWEETPELNKLLNELHNGNVGTTEGQRQETEKEVKAS